ncbi:hypothetical protein [Flavivirga eckloniae]|uniref:Uncharacterized protein n=1 Tax=Flavivirga eckloniae TaxID=1803846 RepID=A0A2K9PR99_9FLAO|nr:hypothetical protein [Flavivirga eckloniae]AUP79566.1 hypothetical protein C1H87_12950 [Flavivirga eckloniae]
MKTTRPLTSFKKVEKRFALVIISGLLILFHSKTFSQEQPKSIYEVIIGLTNEEEKPPLFLINTQEVSKGLIKMLDSAAITYVRALGPKKSLEKYGGKGKNGAIENFYKTTRKIY